MNRRASIAIVWGLLIGELNFAAGPMAFLSDHIVIALIQVVLTIIMIPGLIAAAAVGSLVKVAAINALVHFALCLFT